jgi:hypothetical protein
VKPIQVPHDWRGLPDLIDSPGGARCPICLGLVGGLARHPDSGEWFTPPAVVVHNPTEAKTFYPCGCTVGPADREP